VSRASAAERTVPLSHAGIESARAMYKAQKVRWRLTKNKFGSYGEPYLCSSTGATLVQVRAKNGSTVWVLTRDGKEHRFSTMVDAAVAGEKR
jgi:hypothetical protein